MIRSSLIYYQTKNTNDYNQILDICTKFELSLFKCSKLDELYYIMNKVNPIYIVFDTSKTLNQELFIDFSKNYPNSYIFIISNDCKLEAPNIFVVKDFEHLYNSISSFNKIKANEYIPYEEEKKYYNFVMNELDKLSFRSKLLGAKYMTELICNFYTNSSISNFKCKNIYEKIASKHNTKTSSVERAIRFSILKAYMNCKNKQLYFDISKTTKIPSIKEIANYILDKMTFNLSSEKRYVS